jgi:hypothetical protein
MDNVISIIDNVDYLEVYTSERHFSNGYTVSIIEVDNGMFSAAVVFNNEIVPYYGTELTMNLDFSEVSQILDKVSRWSRVGINHKTPLKMVSLKP